MEEISGVIMEVTAELLEENERLRVRLKNYKERELSKTRFSDFVIVIIFAVAYLLFVHFVMWYAQIGVLAVLVGLTEMEASIIIGLYMTANIFLYMIGIMVALWMVLDIYDEQVTNFIHKHASGVARGIEEQEDDDEFEFLDEEIVKNIEEEIKRDLDNTGFVDRRMAPKQKTTTAQPRGYHGHFVKKDTK